MNKIKRMGIKVFLMVFYYSALVWLPPLFWFSHRFGELKYVSAADLRVWEKAMLQMLEEYCRAGYNFRIRQVLFTFANSKIEIVRKREAPSAKSPIVVLCVKNDRERLQMLVEHYRQLGVERFAFLDNMSTDGTWEWLLEQQDIDLYRCREKYQTMVKEGWINRLVSHYGLDRWYIVTDSDELIVYDGMEEHLLSDVIRFAEEKGIKRFKGLTLDAYSKGRLFGKTANIREDYRFIDRDSYEEKEGKAGSQRFHRFIGGPRYRLMQSQITLSKYPLVYFEKGTVSDSAHYQFPHELLANTACYFGILHYKFIDKDLAEYEKRARKNSGFSTGGAIYRQYMKFVKNQNDNGFMYEGSMDFQHSSVLRSIDLIQSIPFDQE